MELKFLKNIGILKESLLNQVLNLQPKVCPCSMTRQQASDVKIQSCVIRVSRLGLDLKKSTCEHCCLKKYDIYFNHQMQVGPSVWLCTSI